MSIYEVPNIEYCTVEEIGDPLIFYRITTNDRWYIHRNDGDGETAKTWKTATMLRYDEDPAILQIVHESVLPEDAEIYVATNKS